MGAVLRVAARAVSAGVGLAIIVVAIGLILLVRTQYGVPSAFGGGQGTPMTADELRNAAAGSLEQAIGPGGSGISFDVVQHQTLHAKPDGPRIELRDPADPETIVGVVDEYQVGSILSRGGLTAEAFWMELSVASKDQPTEFSAATFFSRVLQRDGELWRDDGAGWYLTDASPGVGMDPATARLLPSMLRSLGGATALEPALLDGRLLLGVRGTSTPDAFPGVIAADGAAFTEQSFTVDCWFDDQGRLVRLEARARNLNQDTYDLVSATTVTLTYGPPGDPPVPTPTMAPEALPTSEPEAAEVGA